MKHTIHGILLNGRGLFLWHGCPTKYGYPQTPPLNLGIQAPNCSDDMTDSSALPGIGVVGDIPPFLRLPDAGTREATEAMVRSIDNRIRRLERLGLRPYPNMLEFRSELVR